MSEKLYQVKAGYSGEVDVDRILPEIGLPQDVIVLKGLTLEILPNFFAQLDTLILTRKRIILLEIKKYAGTVIFDVDSGKTIKISPNGEIEKFDCILHQLDRAAHGIKSWLEKRQFNIPVEPILVMANQRTVIEEIPKTFTVNTVNNCRNIFVNCQIHQTSLHSNKLAILPINSKAVKSIGSERLRANYITFLRRTWKSAYFASIVIPK